jgi:hypothetical protein
MSSGVSALHGIRGTALPFFARMIGWCGILGWYRVIVVELDGVEGDLKAGKLGPGRVDGRSSIARFKS